MSYQPQQGAPASFALAGPAPSTEESPATQREIEEAALTIRQSALIQIERIQAFADGAELAVEQVQDIRFKLLEQRFNASANSALIAAVMTGVLESTLPGRALVFVARHTAGPMLRMNKLFQVLPDSRERAKVVLALRAERARARAGGALFTADFYRSWHREFGPKPKDWFNLRRYAAALVRGQPAATQNGIAFAKAVWAGIDKVRLNEDVIIDPVDTAGVNVMAAAQEYASNNRFMTLFHAATMESIVRSSNLAKEHLDIMVELLVPGAIDITLAEVRRKYKMFFEAVIWAKLYGFDRTQGTGIGFAGYSIKGVEDELLDYWFVRFAHQIEEWSQGNPVGTPGFGTATGINPIADGTFASLSRQQRVSYVHQYLTAIGKAVPEDPTAFKAEGVR